MAKVYVVNDMHHNFKKAERFGKITYITSGKVPIYKTDVVKNLVKKGMEKFNAKEDYLLLSGHVLVCVIAALQVVKGDTPIKLLVFDAKTQDYFVRHISL